MKLEKIQVFTNRKPKIPRKLRIGLKHLELVKREISLENKDGTISRGFSIYYRIKKGYPHTKWARKALRLINRYIQVTSF